MLQRLKSRRLLSAVTSDKVESLKGSGAGVYLGIDPTADGLHVGHLAGVLALRELQKSGLRPIALVGGATGMIGDPSGRDSERDLLDVEQVESNVRGLRRDLGRLLDFSDGIGSARLVNNADWFSKMSSLEFLRDVGKHFRVGTMLSRESVKGRMGKEDGGISFTEFSYQLLQGYDFLHLYRNMGCRVQLGGSDQWGNIVSGVDLIRRVEASPAEAFGVTIPLLTTRTGQKFGKSAGNAVWLDESKTSDYAFYQYFVRVDDQDVEDLLFKLTSVEVEEIQALMETHGKDAHLRIAQKRLAAELMRCVRGEDNLRRAELASQALFGSSLEHVSASDLLSIATAGDVPLSTMNLSEVEGMSVVDVAFRSGLTKSKGEAKRLANSNGLYINNRRVESAAMTFEVARDSIDNSVVLLRSGKKNYQLLHLQN